MMRSIPAHSGVFVLLARGQESDAACVRSHTASGAMAVRRVSSSFSVSVYGVQVLVSVVTWVQKSLQQSMLWSVEMGTMMFRSMHVAPSSSRTWPGAWPSFLKTGRQPLRTSSPVDEAK